MAKSTHPVTKSHPDVGCSTLYSNISLLDVSREELLERYHAVLYALGASMDNQLGIPGEDRPGSYAATEFVAWYNGHPDFADHQFCLDGGRAVVIGNGNVALDVARMLMLHRDALASTDTADHALAAFARATVDEVVLLGRRGPAEAAFTNPELRELADLRHTDVIVSPDQVDGVGLPEDPTKRRNVEILRDYAHRETLGHSHRIELRFLRSPVEILGQGQYGPVRGVRVGVNQLETGEDGRIRAVPTGKEEIIECGLVLRSIGYRGRPLAGIPFDDGRGLIRNREGRVCDDDGTILQGEYVVGWIKRGASGVIGTNKKDAAGTVRHVIADREAGALNEPTQPAREAIETWLRDRLPDLISWGGWQAIDAHEVRAGEAAGRPRVKLVRLAELVHAGGRKSTTGTEA